MLIFTGKARAVLDTAIVTWGTEIQRQIWHEWADRNPKVRRGPDDPSDDGTGPTPDALREVIVDCLRQNYEFLIERIDRYNAAEPEIYTEDDQADDCNDAAYLRSIAHSQLGVNPEWPAG